MSGTALYRALVSAGAPADEAKEAAGEIDNMNSILLELRTSTRIILGLILIILAFIFKLSFG